MSGPPPSYRRPRQVVFVAVTAALLGGLVLIAIPVVGLVTSGLADDDSVAGSAPAGLASDRTTTTTARASRPASTPSTMRTSSSTTAGPTPAERNALLNRSVAIIWSGILDADSTDDLRIVATQQTRLERALDVELLALDGNDFGTLRNGALALAVDLDFGSPQDAVRWCVSVGRSTRDECFGVQLSDDGGPGDLRVYP